jgi:hypothetical protein
MKWLQNRQDAKYAKRDREKEIFSAFSRHTWRLGGSYLSGFATDSQATAEIVIVVPPIMGMG